MATLKEVSERRTDNFWVSPDKLTERAVSGSPLAYARIEAKAVLRAAQGQPALKMADVA